MDYLQNALQNNQKSDDIFDFTAPPKPYKIKMPIGKTDRSFDLEIDDDVMSEILKDRQRDLLAEQNLQREKLKKIQEENEYNDFFGLNKAVDRRKKREEDIFSLPKAEYDALFAPPKAAAPQRNYPNILQNNRQNTQQNQAPNYAVTREQNMGQNLQSNTQKMTQYNDITPDTVYPDRESIYQNPLLKQAQTSIMGGQKSDDTYKNFMLDTPQARKKIEYNEGRGYPNKSNPHPSEKQGKKRILVVTAEGINSKKEDGKREPAWDVLRKQLESYGDFEVDMPQDLSFYDYDVDFDFNNDQKSTGIEKILSSIVNGVEVGDKGFFPTSDVNSHQNAKKINDYINAKVANGNIGDYYDGVFLVGYSGGGESADAMATILSNSYNIDVNKINKIGAPSFIGGDFEKLNEKTFNIAFQDDNIFNHYGFRKNPAGKTVYMDNKIDVGEKQDKHEAYFTTPEATEIAIAEITNKIRSYFKETIDFDNSTQKYLKRKGAIDKYGQTNTIL